VERAVRHEICRQAAVLDAGGKVVQETRHFQEDSGTTTPGRSKETAEDYRYFPEPDLVPLAPPAEWVEELRAALPELPTARRRRLQAEWNLTDQDMDALISASALDSVEATVAAGASPEAARKWWLGELARTANEQGVEVSALPITPAQVAEVAALVEAGRLNDKLARQVLEHVLAGEGTPEEIVAAHGLEVVSDTGALGAAVDAAIAANAAVVEKIRGGKVQAVGALVGAVMKETRGQADAATVKALILEKLGVSE
jgi:aspartyl-tRNA(Asn)/glutamyl-tRNA(Gln) amidotransferase subunit B